MLRTTEGAGQSWFQLKRCIFLYIRRLSTETIASNSALNSSAKAFLPSTSMPPHNRSKQNAPETPRWSCRRTTVVPPATPDQYRRSRRKSGLEYIDFPDYDSEDAQTPRRRQRQQSPSPAVTKPPPQPRTCNRDPPPPVHSPAAPPPTRVLNPSPHKHTTRSNNRSKS